MIRQRPNLQRRRNMRTGIFIPPRHIAARLERRFLFDGAERTAHGYCIDCQIEVDGITDNVNAVINRAADIGQAVGERIKIR